MDKQPILSLCIPTNGAVEWILPVIESIYSQGYDTDKFEVVITDNGKDSQLPVHIARMDYPNLRYKQTTDEGFLNLVSCLKEGNGLFCKMINHRSVMLPGSISNIVSLLEKYKTTQPVIYCSDGIVKGEDVIECGNLDSFVYTLSYLASWSAGIGFWRKDIENINSIALDSMFPNASLLFNLPDNSKYVIINLKYQQMVDDSGKGGYDLFDTFAIRFLDIIKGLLSERRISDKTFLKVKKDLFGFLALQYKDEVILPSNHAFILQNIRKSMQVYYGSLGYYLMVIKAYLMVPYDFCLSMTRRLLRHK